MPGQDILKAASFDEIQLVANECMQWWSTKDSGVFIKLTCDDVKLKQGDPQEDIFDSMWAIAAMTMIAWTTKHFITTLGVF
jgi:hypothetical protein